jgi:hypothetical protein
VGDEIMSRIRTASFVLLPISAAFVAALAACSGESEREEATVASSALSSLSVTQIGVFHEGTWSLDANWNHRWDGIGPNKDAQYVFGSVGGTPLLWHPERDPQRVVYDGTQYCFDPHGSTWDGGACLPANLNGAIPIVYGGCVYGFKDGHWTLDRCPVGSGPSGSNPLDKTMTFGSAGDIPVVGTWNESSPWGRAEGIGVFNAGAWYLDTGGTLEDIGHPVPGFGNGKWDEGDTRYNFGQAGDIPVVGDWTGDGRSKIGVFRAGTWFLDMNANGKWDGNGIDSQFAFGSPGDTPVVGRWPRNTTQSPGGFPGH